MKKSHSAGYRVHFARLKNIRAEISAMRTHKFLCEIPESGRKDVKEKFEKVAKVVDSAEEGSILWFLIQMYGLGFCVARTPEKKRELLKILDSDFKSPADEIQNWLEAKNTEKTRKIKSSEKLLDYLLKAPRKPLEQFKKWETDPKKIPTFVSDTFSIFGVSSFFEIKNDLILNPLFEKTFAELQGNKGDKFLEKLKMIFADFFEIPKIAEIKKEDTTTFFFNPYFWEKNGRKNDDKTFEVFEVLFTNIFPTATFLSENGKIKDAEKEILGTANNQGGLSNFLNDALSVFQKSENATKELIREQNIGFFEKNTELLDFLAKKVFAISTKVKKAKEENSPDFIAQNWSEYRSLIGGRLEGWVSNFERRLKEFQEVLADSIHERELDEWRVSEAVRDFLFEEKRSDGTFVFKDLPKDFEKQKFPFQIGEVLEEQELSQFRFWGKGKEKGDLQKRRDSIQKCAKNILVTICENTDFENIFPESFKNDFEKLEKLCDPLLAKLRATTLGIHDKNPDRNLGKMIAEYFEFWQPINEFLQKWENEGVPKMIKIDDENEEQEMVIWDNTKKNPDPKPEKFWIVKSLLADKKEKEEENESDHESELEIVGKWKKWLIPSELPKYPRFLYEAAKDPQKQIFDAANVLPNILVATEKFVGAIEKQKDEQWESKNWKTTVKKGEMKWHFGSFHKSLEALLKIAVRAKNPKKIIEFLDSFVEWDDAFFENLKTIRSGKTGFDAQKEREKIENAKTEWKNAIAEKRIKTEKLANFHFYLSGKEYGFVRYGAVPTKSILMIEFLERFETHFGLQKGDDLKKFLEIENGGATDNSPTKAEFLKFWWARRVQNLSDKISIPDFSNDKMFSENVLKNLVIGKTEIPRADAQRFLTAGLGSDLRAKIGIVSRKSFIARNVVCAGNGTDYQSFFQFVPREFGDFVENVKITGKTHAERRRQKLAARPILEKLQKRLKRTENNLKKLSPENPDFEILQKRAEILKSKITKLENDGKFGFSNLAKCALKAANIQFENRKNSEIANEIWKKDLDQNRELAKVLGEIPHKWMHVLRTKQEIIGLEESRIRDGFFFGKSSGTKIFNQKPKGGKFLYAFPIQTSVVQKQFLEKFLWGDRDEILTEKIMGPSVILETEKMVQWENAVPKIIDGETKMFVAIPFQFSKGKTGEIPEKRKLENTEIEIVNSSGKSQKQYRRERNILGIDLGEYGFGFAIFDPREKKFVKSGFIEIPFLQKMRDDAASWKDTQSSGIFSRPTTHLANIREQAAGAVRSQIHALALRFDAIPIYEDSVDAFETGGARISKLYKTLKTSDVIGGNSNEADKTVRKHFWGLDFAQIGGVIGASKTSQTCRKCGRCATSEIENFAKIAEESDKNQTGLFSAEQKSVAQKNGAKIYFEIFGGKIVGTDIFCGLENGEHEKSEVLKMTKKAQRRESEKEKIRREVGKKGRGTIEEFECQICKNVADCDAQAAKNIALKYFFKITATKKEQAQFTDQQTGNFSSLKYFLEKSKQDEWKNL